MNLKNLTFSHFEKLHNAGYNLDLVYLLFNVESGVDIKELCKESARLSALYQGLYRKGLITDEDGLTLTGKELIKFITEEHEPEDKPKRRKTTSDFETWWKAYPGTDTFTHKGKSFTGTRTLRARKDECKLKFDKILEEGEYVLQDLLDALGYEVLQKKENSVKTKTNRMTFMQNSLTYLNQRTFEPFIELIKEGKTIESSEEDVQGGTDI